MRVILAELFRLLFRSPFFKKRFFGIHKRIFSPLNLFKGVVRTVPFKGLRIVLHIDDWIQQNIYFLGDYEKAELNSIENFLQEDSNFIDIGANFGLYTLYASRIIKDKGQIISFEPFSQNYNALSRNATLNNLTHVCLEKIAIGEQADTIHLYYDEQEQNLGMASAKPVENGIKEEVPVTSLDLYLKDKSLSKIDLIKIDIEGFEFAALRGMKETLEAYSPALLIEIFDNDAYNSNEVQSFLENLGYQKYYIDDKGNVQKTEVNPNRMNYIFIKKNL